MINVQLILRKPHKSVVMENLDFRKTHYPSFPFVVRKLRLWLPLGGIRLPGLHFSSTALGAVTDYCLADMPIMESSTGAEATSILSHHNIYSAELNSVILCLPLLLLPSVFPSIRVFSNELTLHIRWPKYWSFSFSIKSFQQRCRSDFL